MLKDRGDWPQPDKKSTQSVEHHQLAKSANDRVIPYRYKPSEEVIK